MSYSAQYALSGMAKCRKCRVTLEKGSLRLSAMLKTKKLNDKEIRAFFHPHCFFARFRKLEEHDISNINRLNLEDQTLIRNYLNGTIQISLKDKPKKSVLEEVIENSGEFYVERAKSNRSQCISCEGWIDEAELRISQKDYTSETVLALPISSIDRWRHVDCFVADREKLEFFDNAFSLPGLDQLDQLDIDYLLEKLPEIEIEKKIKQESAPAAETVTQASLFEEEKKIDNESELPKKKKTKQKSSKGAKRAAKTVTQASLSEDEKIDNNESEPPKKKKTKQKSSKGAKRAAKTVTQASLSDEEKEKLTRDGKSETTLNKAPERKRVKREKESEQSQRK